MQLVKMQPADIDSVLGIEMAANQFPWSRKNFEDSLRAGYIGWVGKQQNNIIAFTIVQNILDEMHLLNLGVIPSQQGKGLGKNLLNFVISQARHRNASLIVLEVRRSNHRAQQLYINSGFNEMSVRRGYYPAKGGREDAVLMGLDLMVMDEVSFNSRNIPSQNLP